MSLANVLALVCLGSLIGSLLPVTKSGRWIGVSIGTFALMVLLLAAA